MSSGDSKVLLASPVSLPSLGLTPQSSLDDAVKALLRAHDETKVLQASAPKSTQEEDVRRRSTAVSADDDAAKQEELRPQESFPPRDHLLVLCAEDDDKLLDSSPGKSVNEAVWKVLGGTFATKNSGKSLVDLGLPPSEGRAVGPYLCLAANTPGTTNHKATAGLRIGSRVRKGCRACGSRCRRGTFRAAKRGVAFMPKCIRDRLEPHVKSLGFYWLCARWALAEAWEERSVLIGEVKQALFGDGSDAPTTSEQVKEELQPFRWAAFAALLVFIYRVVLQVLSADMSPEMLEMFKDA